MDSNDNSGNGEAPIVDTIELEKFKKLQEFQRGDGLISGLGKEKLGILHTLVTVPPDEKDYRNLIFKLNFPNRKRARLFAAALDSCLTWGVSPDFLFYREIAECAARDKGTAPRFAEILESLTHSTFTTNRAGGSEHAKGKSNSPLSQ